MKDKEPNTFTGGYKPIDGVWVLVELEIGGFKILPFLESVGNHRTMGFDVSTQLLIGEFKHWVVRAACRRLNIKTASLSRYNAVLKRLMTAHKIEERLDAIIDVIVDDKPTAAQKTQMDGLDGQFMELQTHAERKCRKILKPELQFSGPVKLWHERMQAYQALVRWKKGNTKNDSNIIRTVR